jgi:hypothetical protein
MDLTLDIVSMLQDAMLDSDSYSCGYIADATLFNNETDSSDISLLDSINGKPTKPTFQRCVIAKLK